MGEGQVDGWQDRAWEEGGGAAGIKRSSGKHVSHQVKELLKGALAMAGGLLKEAHPVVRNSLTRPDFIITVWNQVEKVRSWLADEDWEALGQAAHYARANLAKVVGRVPGALGTLLDVVGDLGLEDAGRLGAAIGKVANLLEEGDLQALEDTIGEILEAGWSAS